MRATVKTWLKSQEKAKTDGQDKTDAQEEAIVPPNADKQPINGDAPPDMAVSTEVVAEDHQPPSEAMDRERTRSET